MRHLVTLCLAAPLAACASLLAHQDSQSAALAGGIESEARTFFAGLAGATGPDCDFDHNTAAYDHLDSLAAGLQARIGAVRASPMLTTAGSKLAQAIADARESHRLASADATDANGTCMAPAAIALNANAIARAAAALAASQNLPSQNQPSQDQQGAPQ